MRNIFFILLIAISSLTIVNSQNLKSPSEFLGYNIGEQFSRHHQVIDYFEHVAHEMHKNVILEKYGETNERRSLNLAYISSEENLRNLETIRENNFKTDWYFRGYF